MRGGDWPPRIFNSFSGRGYWTWPLPEALAMWPLELRVDAQYLTLHTSGNSVIGEPAF
jgi:hypothetical protein